MSSLFPDLLHPERVLPALFLASLLSAPVRADELVLAPSVSLREEYNDNVSASTSGRQSDYITTLSPMLTVSEGTERLNASLTGGVNSTHYLNRTKSSALGYALKGAGTYMGTPRLSLSTEFGYTRDSSASSIDPATSLVVSSRTERQSYRLGGRYRVTERLSTSLGLGYARDDYDSRDYLGTRHYVGNAGFDYNLSSRFTGVTLSQLVTFRRDATDISEVNNLSMTLGLSKELNQLWQLSLNAGGRFTMSEFQVSGDPNWETHEEGGALGGLSLAYKGERLGGTLALSHDLTGASGRSGATRRTGGSLTLSERFTRRLTGQLAAGHARNRAEQGQFGGQAIDERSSNLGGSLRYQLLEFPSDLSLEASYSYNNTDYRLLGTHMVQNVVMLLVNWQRRSKQ